MRNRICALLIVVMIGGCGQTEAPKTTVTDSDFAPGYTFQPFQPPVGYDEARERAQGIVQQMTLDEKISMIGGYNLFFIKGFEKFGVPSLYLSDATQGVNIRSELDDQLEKSVAFPCPIALTSTWNTELAETYARAIGEECRAGEIAVLLGPGMNSYRIAQNGRNFEYFGEDPFLAARMVENYVVGMQSTGTISTLKHFIANNSDHKRRTSNSVVDDRALHEIYLPAFEAGVDAGAMAVMTSYNLVNGEYAGQSKDLITGLLREELGFQWLVMSDWWSVWDAEKVIQSGLDLDMPGEPQDWMPEPTRREEFYLRNVAKTLLESGKVQVGDIDRMVTNILTTEIAMGLLDRPIKDTSYLAKFEEHEQIALQTARESIVLLKNNGVLPIDPDAGKTILLTGYYANNLPRGGGSANVDGYDHITALTALKEVFGDQVVHVEDPDDAAISGADYVIYCNGTYDSEGWDKPFDLPDEVNAQIKRIASLNPNTVVAISSGGGRNMSGWNDDIAGLLYTWYPGQIGFKAFAEIVAGITNPSAKLPITIEKRFEDSPGYPYLPEGEELASDWSQDMNLLNPVHDVVYDEGVLVGYRWYDTKAIEPLYAFGHGLSYTSYDYGDLVLETTTIGPEENLRLKIDITNTGKRNGQEIVQLYVRDLTSSVERPKKELKGFRKVMLAKGAQQTLHFTLTPRDFAFWDTESKDWNVEPGQFEIWVGSASNDIRSKAQVEVTH